MINQRPPELGEYKGSVCSCPLVLRGSWFFQLCPGFFVILDPRGRLGE